MKTKLSKIIASGAILGSLILVFLLNTHPTDKVIEHASSQEVTSKTVELVEDFTTIQTKTLTPSTVNQIDTRDKDVLSQLIEDCDTKIAAAQSMREACETFGYAITNPIYNLAAEETANAQELRDHYQSVLDEVIAEEEAAEQARRAALEADSRKTYAYVPAGGYETATAVWNYFKSRGFNDYVTAGIIGNMMAEVGGQTLNIDASVGSSSYYGLCQWMVSGYPAVYGMSRDEQLDFLANTMPNSFNNYGYLYADGFNYQSFLNMTDPGQVALAFAKVYERCGSGSYAVRQENANVALNYFTN